MVKSGVNMLFELQKCENTIFFIHAIKILIWKSEVRILNGYCSSLSGVKMNNAEQYMKNELKGLSENSNTPIS
jgi:hypothetical protein